MAEIKVPVVVDGYKCVEDMAQAVLNYTYKGKTLKEWADRISKPQINADRIRAMTDEELSIALCLGGCPPTAWDEYGVLDCPKPNEEVCEEVCGSCWLDWLKQEAQCTSG